MLFRFHCTTVKRDHQVAASDVVNLIWYFVSPRWHDINSWKQVNHTQIKPKCTHFFDLILPTSEKNTLKIITCQNRSRRLQLKKLPQNLYHISIHHLQREMKFKRKKFCSAQMRLCTYAGGSLIFCHILRIFPMTSYPSCNRSEAFHFLHTIFYE